MARMTGGRAVVEALIREGVDRVFGIPGVHTMEIYDELYERRDDITHVVSRHEGGAGFMADGYARASGEIGVCLVITGPGVTNATTALGQAYSDSSPVLMISSQNDTEHMDRDVGALHQLKDQLSVTDGCTAWTRRVMDPADIPEAISDAAAYLRTHRPRPVHIDIPTDVLESEAEISFADSGRTAEQFAPSPARMDQAVQMLADAERPLIWVGGGATGAGEEITELAEMLDAAVVMTCAGKGVVREDHPLNIGSRLRGDDERVVQDFVATGDIVLVIGSELGVVDTMGGQVQLSERMIRVDVDAPGGDKLYRPELEIRSDARIFCRQLLQRLRDLPEDDFGAGDSFRAEISAVQDALETEPADDGGPRPIIDSLRQSLGDEDIVVCDMTMLCYRATALYPAYAPNTLLFPRGFGTLGWGLPAAVGVQMGAPNRQVVTVCGDGGFMFTVQELATAVKYQLPIAILLMNNDSYGVVDKNMRHRYDRAIGCDIANPDFMQMAESFGIAARRLNDASELPAALEEAADADGPTLIEFCVDF